MRTLAGRLLIALWLWILWLACPEVGSTDGLDKQGADLEVFTREGCSRCAAAERFLTDLQQEHPTLRIVVHDVAKDPAALARLRELAARHAAQTVGVPAFSLQEELLIGYAGPDTTEARLRALLERPQPLTSERNAPAGACLPEEGLPCESAVSEAGAETAAIQIPFLGIRLTDQRIGLPLFTVVLGLLDGFNPCSMWVLILMLSMLASLKDRLKMVLIAGTFVAVEGVAYF